MTDSEPEPEPPTETAPPTPAEPAAPASRRPGRGLLILALGALVVAVAAAALALGQSGEIDDLRAERDDRREVARVASSFASTYMTVDFEDVDSTSADLEGLITEAFAAAFSERREPLRDSFAALETSTVATTKEVYVGDIEGDQAVALVVLDVELSSTATGDRTIEDLSILLDLLQVDGEWRVDRQRPGPQPDLGGDDVGATPSTTAPAAPTTTTAPAP